MSVQKTINPDNGVNHGQPGGIDVRGKFGGALPPGASSTPIPAPDPKPDLAEIVRSYMAAVKAWRETTTKDTRAAAYAEVIRIFDAAVAAGHGQLSARFKPDDVPPLIEVDPATDAVNACKRKAHELAVEWNHAVQKGDPDHQAKVYAAMNAERERLKAAVEFKTFVATFAAEPAAPGERFPIYTFDEMVTRPPLKWTIKGVMPAEGVGAIFGPAGSGKTFLLFDMLASIATGSPWFDRRARKTPVLYIALEGAAGFQQRAAAYAKRFGIKPEMLFITSPLDICDPADVTALIEAIRAKGWKGNGVVAVDTLNAAMPGRDENGPEDMGAAIAGLKAIQRAFGGVALVVHHTGKDTNKGLRGHSSLHGALDVAIEVAREGLAPVRSWNTAKLKDGADGDGPAFMLESVYLGNDEDGDAITSCVIARVLPGEAGTSAADAPQGRLGKNQKLALEILNKLFSEPAASMGLPATVPEQRPALAWEVAKVAVGKDYQTEERRKGPEARRVIQGLIENGRLATDGEYIWPTLPTGAPAERDATKVTQQAAPL